MRIKPNNYGAGHRGSPLDLWEFVCPSLSCWRKSWITYGVLRRDGMNLGKFSNPYVKLLPRCKAVMESEPLVSGSDSRLLPNIQWA